MGDPREFGDPDHYRERFRGDVDNGGVHINSGIPNHAYYLVVNGGRNRGCTGSTSGHRHTVDCDRVVDAIGLNLARRTFYPTYPGRYDSPLFSPCIGTRIGIVQLVTDGSVTDRGFTVNGVRRC